MATGWCGSRYEQRYSVAQQHELHTRRRHPAGCGAEAGCPSEANPIVPHQKGRHRVTERGAEDGRWAGSEERLRWGRWSRKYVRSEEVSAQRPSSAIELADASFPVTRWLPPEMRTACPVMGGRPGGRWRFSKAAMSQGRTGWPVRRTHRGAADGAAPALGTVSCQTGAAKQSLATWGRAPSAEQRFPGASRSCPHASL